MENSGRPISPNPSKEIYLARQPILDARSRLYAYEFLFRQGESNEASVPDDFHATSAVITRAFSELALDVSLGKAKAFINIDRKMLFSDVIELLPTQQVVLELLETIEPTTEVVDRCIELRTRGFMLALDDVIELGPKFHEILPFVDIVKVDIKGVHAFDWPELLAEVHRFSKKALAEKVDTREDQEECLRLGFDLFQGYYFARPDMLRGKALDPSLQSVLQLLALIQAEADDMDIEMIFKRQPGLTFSLLKLSNSVAFGFSSRITTLRQAMTVLGRRQLRRWLYLLLYTVDNAGEAIANPLLKLAATRGRLMEQWQKRLTPNDSRACEQAFMVGILSLSPALLHQPMEDIVSSLQLGDDIARTLMDCQGKLGALLRLAISLENEETHETRHCLSAFPTFSPENLLDDQIEALAWVEQLTETS